MPNALTIQDANTKPQIATVILQNMPTSLNPGESFVSGPIIVKSFFGLLAIALTSEMGSVSIQRYIDRNQTIPMGMGNMLALNANVSGFLNINDGMPFQSCIITITNTSQTISSIKLNVFAYVIQNNVVNGSSPVSSSNLVTVLVGGQAVSGLNPFPVIQNINGTIISEENPMPTTFNVDGSPLSSSNPLPIVGSVALSAGSATIGNVGVISLPSLSSGTNSIGTVNVTSLPILSLSTSTATIGNVGVISLPSIPAGINLIGSVNVASLPSIPAGSASIGSVSVTALPALASGTNNIGSVTVTTMAPLVTGTATIGNVGVISLPPLPTGTNTLGAINVVSLPALSAGSNAIGTVSVSSSLVAPLITTLNVNGVSDSVSNPLFVALSLNNTTLATSNPLPVTLVSSVSTGAATYFNSALSNAVVSVKSSKGNLAAITLHNPGITEAWVQLFDAVTSSVTLGTTLPKLSYGVPAFGYYDFSFPSDGKPNFATAISIASASSATGSTAPASSLIVDFIFV